MQACLSLRCATLEGAVGTDLAGGSRLRGEAMGRKERHDGAQRMEADHQRQERKRKKSTQRTTPGRTRRGPKGLMDQRSHRPDASEAILGIVVRSCYEPMASVMREINTAQPVDKIFC